MQCIDMEVGAILVYSSWHGQLNTGSIRNISQEIPGFVEKDSDGKTPSSRAFEEDDFR